jgi:membrane-bound serine protease (ClpP class)
LLSIPCIPCQSNYAGLALIIFGIILFLLEIKIVSHGLLAYWRGSLLIARIDDADKIRVFTGKVVKISRAVIFAATGRFCFILFVCPWVWHKKHNV